MFTQHRPLFFIFFILFQVKLFAISRDTTVVHKLENVVISAPKLTLKVVGSPNTILKIDMNLMKELPKILGNSDPIHYTQMLAGVESNSEFDSGLHIQGCDNSHNQVSISGVPLYNVAHMLGLFSVFNASHFSNMLCVKSAHSSSHPNRLGGEITLLTQDTVQKKFSGSFDIGPISSQGTLKIPVTNKSMLLLSGRKAYINLLYDFMLNIDGNKFDYDFSDYNFTYLFSPNKNNRIWIDGYWGEDNFGIFERDYQSDTSLKWGNKMVAAHWNCSNGVSELDNSVFVTKYYNNLSISQQLNYGRLPSSIQTYGYKGIYRYNQFESGVEALWHNIHPQRVIENYIDVNNEDKDEKENSCEFSFYAQYKKELYHSLFFSAGVRASTFLSYDKKNFYAVDPSAQLTYYSDFGKWAIQYASSHQFISQTGFTSMGMPTEFWYSCSLNHHPQRAHSFSLSYDNQFYNGKYSFSAELYYKRLFNQEEYKSDLIQIITTPYNFDEIMLRGKGLNYGLNLMVNKRSGRLTGWISYSLARSLRKFNGIASNKYYPSNHERIHELNVVANYSLSKCWQVGGTSVFASGTPFTAPSNFYMINSQLITEYGEHNANRLAPYFRIDASVNYFFKRTQRIEHGINFSLYNLTYYKNDLFYRLKIYKDKYSYSPVRFFVKTIPSVNYFIRF